MKLNWTWHFGTLLVVGLFLCSVSAFPQAGSASLDGRITDQAGLAVVGAKVKAENVSTNNVYSAQTNEAGLYNIPVIQPGSYRLSVEKAGFETIDQSGIELHVADNVAMNFALVVGSVTQSVTVVGEVPLVNTSNSSLGGTVNDEKMADLPLNGRNYADLTFMQPGVAISSNGASSQQQGGTRGTPFSSDGAPVRSNLYTLDGAVLTGTRGASTASEGGTTLGVGGIKEYKVVSGVFGAEYGMSPGAQVVMVSKGGTNQFHGEAFEYLRNNVMDAANYFDTPVAANNFERLPPFKRNNFGGSFGGPIKKDKTFVFAAYEGLRQRLGQTIIDTVPGAGCHGAANAVITSTACPQLGAGAASVKIAPVMASILALFPIPNLPNNQYTFPSDSPSQVDWGQIRVDQNISQSDTLFGRYTTDRSYLTSVSGLRNGAAGVSAGAGFPQFGVSAASYDQFATISENHIFSTTVLNQARFSYSRSHFSENNFYPNGDASFTGPQYSFVAGQPVGQISISGFATWGSSTSVPATGPANIYTLNDDLYFSKGKHALKFGVAINRFNYGFAQPFDLVGAVSFTGIAGFLQGQSSTYAALKLGPSADFTHNWMYSVPGFYAQDDWRLLPRLTLNLGVRYEFLTMPYETAGKSYALRNPTTDASFTQGAPWASFSKLHFEPRVGFAWDVQGNGKTAVRGGFGQYFDIGNLNSILTGGKQAESPLDALLTHTSSTTIITLPLTFAPTDPIGLETANYHFENPYMLKWDLTVERQFPLGIALQVAYVGTDGVHLYQSVEGNPNPPTAIVNGMPYWNGTEPRENPNFGYAQTATTGGKSTYNALQVALNKHLTHGIEFQMSYTYSKSLDNALSGQGASECTGASGMTQGDYYGPGNLVFVRGPSCNDVTHNVRVNMLYHVPNINSDNFAAKMEHGWWVGTIWSAQTGYPFTPILGSNRSQSQILRTLSDYTNEATPASVAFCAANPGSCKYTPVPFNASTVIEGNPAQWYNPAMFAMAPMVTTPGGTTVCTSSTCGTGTTYGTLGNVSRGLLRGPGLDDVDFSINKDTALPFLGEQGKLEFRAEIFNILNHPNFAMPNGTVFTGKTTDYGPYSESPSSSAGVISSTVTSSRQVQLALKLSF